MFKKLEAFLFGQVFGRVIARLAVSAVSGASAYLASQGIELSSDQQAAAVIAVTSAVNGLYTKFSDWRAKRAAAAAAPAA